MVECWSEESGVEQRSQFYEAISKHCSHNQSGQHLTSQADVYLHGRTCLYSGTRAKNNDASDMLGYGLKIVMMPRRPVMTKSGCLLGRC